MSGIHQHVVNGILHTCNKNLRLQAEGYLKVWQAARAEYAEFHILHSLLILQY